MKNSTTDLFQVVKHQSAIKACLEDHIDYQQKHTTNVTY